MQVQCYFAASDFYTRYTHIYLLLNIDVCYIFHMPAHDLDPLCDTLTLVNIQVFVNQMNSDYLMELPADSHYIPLYDESTSTFS